MEKADIIKMIEMDIQTANDAIDNETIKLRILESKKGYMLDLLSAIKTQKKEKK